MPNQDASGVQRSLPPGWVRAKLREVVDFSRKPKSVSKNGSVPFLPMRLISESDLNISTFESREAPSSGTYFEEGDVLLARITPSFENGKMGVAANLPEKWGIATTEVYALRSRVVSSKYLAYFFRLDSTREILVRSMEGATGRMRVPKDAIEELVIPIPPRAEQDRIVDALEEAMTSIEAAKADLFTGMRLQRMLENSYRQAAFDRDDGTNTVLDEVAHIQSGVAMSPPKGSDLTTVQYIRTANVQAGFLDLDEVKEITLPKDRVERYALKSGDVLVLEGGDADKVGRGWIWRDEVPGAIHQNHVFAVRPDPEKLDAQYLAHYINSPSAREYFLGVAKQTTNLASINKTNLRALPLKLPSVADQQEIVAGLEQRLASSAALSSEILLSVQKLEAMRRSLLRSAFTGKLVPQNPGEENASELLERIKVEKAEREARIREDKARARAAKKKASQGKKSSTKSKTKKTSQAELAVSSQGGRR